MIPGVPVIDSINSCIDEKERSLLPVIITVIEMSERIPNQHAFLLDLNLFYVQSTPHRGIFGAFLSFLESFGNSVKVLNHDKHMILRETKLYKMLTWSPQDTFIFEYYNAFTGMRNYVISY
jgi:hypothetical protein